MAEYPSINDSEFNLLKKIVINTATGGGGGGGAVDSVNGQTGVVVLDAADVGSSPILVSTQNFRITTESGVPVSSTNRASQSTIYFTPYSGNQIALYNGSSWQIVSSPQVSLALSGLVSGSIYDVFVY